MAKTECSRIIERIFIFLRHSFCLLLLFEMMSFFSYCRWIEEQKKNELNVCWGLWQRKNEKPDNSRRTFNAKRDEYDMIIAVMSNRKWKFRHNNDNEEEKRIFFSSSSMFMFNAILLFSISKNCFALITKLSRIYKSNLWRN